MKLTEFKKYSEKDAIENGAFLHFKAPDGKPLYADKDKKEAVGVTLYHVRSKEFVEVMTEARIARKEKFKLKDDEPSTDEYTEYYGRMLGIGAVKDIHHITFDGDDKGLSVAERAELMWEFFEQEKIFFITDQITNFVVNRTNFMKGG